MQNFYRRKFKHVGQERVGDLQAAQVTVERRAADVCALEAGVLELVRVVMLEHQPDCRARLPA